jgi:predicted DNA-binding transcriptional regulator
MHTGRTKVEPVEFLGYIRYGAGDPSQVEVRALDGGRTFQTTVDRLRAPRAGEVTTRGNPSAVYGAFRANPAEYKAVSWKSPRGIRYEITRNGAFFADGDPSSLFTTFSGHVDWNAIQRALEAAGADRKSRSFNVGRKNPSAARGALRANPEIPDVVRRCTYGFPIAGQNIRITAADLYPLASPADKARIERLCRNGSSYSGESGDVLSSIWANLGWPMPAKKNPKRKNPSAVYGAFRVNPDWTEAELFAFLRQHSDGITVKELVYGFGGTSQGHTARLEKLVERGALKRERWAKGGDHYLLPAKKNPASPLQQMQLVARQVAAFKKNYHIPKRRQEIARAIVRMLDKHPMSGQAIPWDVLGGIRSAAREAEHTKSPMVHIGDRVQFFAPGETLKSGQVVGTSGGEYAVQVGNYAYSVKPHDIRRVY